MSKTPRHTMPESQNRIGCFPDELTTLTDEEQDAVLKHHLNFDKVALAHKNALEQTTPNTPIYTALLVDYDIEAIFTCLQAACFEKAGTSLSDEDIALANAMGHGSIAGMESPADKLQQKIAEAAPQEYALLESLYNQDVLAPCTIALEALDNIRMGYAARHNNSANSGNRTPNAIIAQKAFTQDVAEQQKLLANALVNVKTALSDYLETHDKADNPRDDAYYLISVAERFIDQARATATELAPVTGPRR